MLVDAWLLFFSKKVNFMEDITMKYVCISTVDLVDTHYVGVPFNSFYVLWLHRVT